MYNTGTVVVVNCTFSGCGATGGTNGVAGSGRSRFERHVPAVGRGGDIAKGSGTFILRNTILAASSAGTNAYDTSASRITDGGYNISSDASLNLSGTSHKSTDPEARVRWRTTVARPRPWRFNPAVPLLTRSRAASWPLRPISAAYRARNLRVAYLTLEPTNW